MPDIARSNGPIFVVGVPRSGTTLLRLILNSHSQISLGPETHYFKEIWMDRDRYGDLTNRNNLQLLWDTYSKTKYFDDFSFDDISLVRRKIFDTVKSHSDFLRVLLETYARNNNKIMWGEKTPEHLYDVQKILEWYPEAKIIHVIRDPRSVCASLAKVPWASEDVFSNARVWNKYLSFAENLQSSVKKESLQEIYYEDLIQNTEVVLNKICDFIDVKFERDMLYFYRDSKRFVEKNEPWKDNVLSPLNADSIDKWKLQLTGTQQKEIEIKARKLMLKHGYLNNNGHIEQIFDFLNSILIHIRWSLRRFMHHLYKKNKTKI